MGFSAWAKPYHSLAILFLCRLRLGLVFAEAPRGVSYKPMS
jgi:hypothetical protein